MNQYIHFLPSCLLFLQGGSDSDPWMNGFAYTPAIEPQHPEAFITQNQYEVVYSGQMDRVPLMIGMTSEEMLGRADGNYSFI